MSLFSRYRLFFTFLAIPVLVVVLVVVLLMNTFGGGDGGSEAEGQPTQALTAPTRALATLPAGAVSTPTLLPLATPTPTATPTPRPTSTPAPTPTPATREYEVLEGDTLSEVAERFGLSTTELAEFNNIEDFNDIKVGDKLMIPPSSPNVTPLPRPSPSPTPESIKATVDPDNGVNVREEPTTESEVLRTLPMGEEILLTGKKQTIDEIVWYELDDGGWVQGQFLTIEGG